MAVGELFHYQRSSLAIILDAEDFLRFHGANSLQKRHLCTRPRFPLV